MELDDCYRILAEKIVGGSCIAFLGAGVSAPVKLDGRQHPGIPLAADLLASLKTKRDYLHDVVDLGQATFLMRCHEGRSALEVFLREQLDRPQISPLPAHVLLARIGLSCYVSMNFDTLLETALEDESISHVPIIDDNDVALYGGNIIPVIKPHGSVDRPTTMCVASDEVLRFEDRIPVLSHFLTATIANKTALFVGFGMGDPDFLALMRYLKHALKAHMPLGFAVVLRKSDFLTEYWREHNVRVIEHDVTTFLRDLHARVKRLRFQLEEDLEPWMRNQFFWELLDIRSLPTETQVIDALLREVRRQLSDDTDIVRLQGAVQEAVALVVQYRRNYSALYRLGQELTRLLDTCREEGTRPWDALRELERRRAHVRDQLADRAAAALRGSTNVVIYSQSQRVVDCLLAVEPSIQNQITLHIAECRPKSPSHFQDAIATARLLRDSQYPIRILPDMAILHLIRRKAVDLVLMGAHMVYESPTEGFKYFVNTCGSEAVVLVSSTCGIPVKVIFERDKVVALENEEQLSEVSFDEEEYIAREATAALSADAALADRTRILNVGYDLVHWRDNVVAVTEG